MDGNSLGTGNRLAITALIIGEASGVFAGFCPSWFTVSSPFFHEQDAKAGNIQRIRWGEIAATSIVMATGGAMTYISKDPVPLVASAIICVVFIGGYEYMIAHPATGDKGSDNGVGVSSKNVIEIEGAHVATDVAAGIFFA